MALNINRAVTQNHRWSRQLGWYGHYAQIEALIHAVPQNPSQFAQAVAQWQRNHQPRMEVDGIIGPNTWNVLRQEIGVASGSLQGTATRAISGSSVSRGIGATSRASISGEHHALVIRGHTINFYIYVNNPHSVNKVQQLEPFFSRVPDQHLTALYPIFIMDKKPGGRQGGGTWKPEQVPRSFTGTAQIRNTGIPAADIEQLVINPGKGMIGLSNDRWDRSIGRLEFTVFHEVGHCIDFSFPPEGLVPANARSTDYNGMASDRSRCGAGNSRIRQAVEAYARYVCSPSRIFHNLPPSESAALANQRLLSTLRRTSAFSSVPSS